MIALLCALLSGVMFYLSQGLDNVWVLAWIAPAPVLWLAYRGAPRWQVFLAAFVSFVSGQAYVMQCYGRQIPLWLIAPLEVPMCLLFPLAILFAGEVLRRFSPFAALIAFPAFWVTAEYAIGRFSPHGSFGSLAYSEVSFPAGIQIASLFGLYGVTFLLCLVGNAVALIARGRCAAGGVGAAVGVLALGFGIMRLAAPPGATIRVAALADADTWHRENRERTLVAQIAAANTYAMLIRGQHGVRAYVIPEGAIQMRENAQQPVLQPLSEAAKAADALVVVGTYVPDPAQNRAFAFFADGTVKIYAKRHPLAPLETEIPGTSLGLLGHGDAMQICKDMDFAGTVRETAENGARLMIVPANDFGRDGWIHARMSTMRGVKTDSPSCVLPLTDWRPCLTPKDAFWRPHRRRVLAWWRRRRHCPSGRDRPFILGSAISSPGFAARYLSGWRRRCSGLPWRSDPPPVHFTGFLKTAALLRPHSKLICLC